MNDLTNLKSLIGSVFDKDDIICNMNEENDIVIISNTYITSEFENYGICNLFNVYYDNLNSNIYNVWINNNNIIIDVN